MSDDTPIFCDQCTRELTPGAGDFFEITIEAVADPTPPSFDQDDLERDFSTELKALVADLQQSSEREAMDSVHRRVMIYLCNQCYLTWIENPTGS